MQTGIPSWAVYHIGGKEEGERGERGDKKYKVVIPLSCLPRQTQLLIQLHLRKSQHCKIEKLQNNLEFGRGQHKTG